MPAPGFSDAWFPLPFQNRAWYHPDGWVLYPNGEAHQRPPDFRLEPGGQFYFGYGEKAQYFPFDGAGNSPAYRGGGHVYYVPQFDVAVNGKTGNLSLVGRPFSPWWVPDGGYSVTWTPAGPVPGGTQNQWTVSIQIRPDGLAGMPVPWWNGKTYPEYPPLPRGRPRKLP
jgi:hypothetical protein